MGVFRVKKNSNYVVMDKTSLRDERLSWKAKGLHAYMLSMPDDWRFYREELSTHAKDGVDAVKTALKELTTYGYLKRERRNNEQGKLEWETIVYEIPQKDREPLGDIPPMDKPVVEKPPMAKPPVDNPPLLSNELLSNDLLNNNLLNNAAEKGSPENYVSILDRFNQLKGQMHGSASDISAAKEIVQAGVPVDRAIHFLEQRFETYKPEHKRDRINSLSYCVGYVLDRYQEEKERESNVTSISERRRGYAKSRNAGSYGKSSSYAEQSQLLAKQQQVLGRTRVQ
ncbi:hypothetical protein AB1K91_05145 [Terribacillus sp. 179-K 1B1 HS]|uniref:hypothetical protein n=1 Tax=Terribacillus sp. 179-K 1B1 HS TaxID=3142388 RepID=UPI0039A2E55E